MYTAIVIVIGSVIGGVIWFLIGRRLRDAKAGATSARRAGNGPRAAAVAFHTPLQHDEAAAAPASPRDGGRAADVAADALAPMNADASPCGADLADAFEPIEVNPALARIVQKEASQIGDDFFLAQFHEADPNAFAPIDRERAKASASVRPAQQMEHTRANGRLAARKIGLHPNEFARRVIMPTTNAACPMPFNNVDV